LPVFGAIARPVGAGDQFIVCSRGDTRERAFFAGYAINLNTLP
jgi:hypothetical protein